MLQGSDRDLAGWRATMEGRNPKQLDILPARADKQALGRITYAVCGVAGVVEGFGLQSGGMAAPRFAAEFHMAPDHVGLVFLLTSLGLAVGASFGGWVGDRVGSGRAMGVAITLFGLASI